MAATAPLALAEPSPSVRARRKTRSLATATPTQQRYRVGDLLRFDERVHRYSVSFAKKTAFFRISRSIRSSRTCWRSRVNSASCVSCSTSADNSPRRSIVRTASNLNSSVCFWGPLTSYSFLLMSPVFRIKPRLLHTERSPRPSRIQSLAGARSKSAENDNHGWVVSYLRLSFICPPN